MTDLVETVEQELPEAAAATADGLADRLRSAESTADVAAALKASGAV
ncbi:hypothetical protein HF999_08350, partial [Tsukamurella spumae]|nr:hypothetical protein [Tsukamurella spumae]